MNNDDIEDAVETFDGKLNVEISVTSGGVSAVSFTTVIRVDPSDKVAAQNKLRDVANMLRAAIPFTELKGEEAEFNAKDRAPAGVTAAGQPIVKAEAVQQSAQRLAEACKPENKK